MVYVKFQKCFVDSSLVAWVCKVVTSGHADTYGSTINLNCQFSYQNSNITLFYKVLLNCVKEVETL